MWPQVAGAGVNVNTWCNEMVVEWSKLTSLAHRLI